MSQATRLVLVGALALFLAGCEVKIVNRTPAQFSENPSQVYTITAEIKIRSGVLRKGTVKPSIVIDGDIFPMHPSPLGNDLWEYDYRLPAGRDSGAYYILVGYETEAQGRINQRESSTELFHFSVVNRYGLSLDASRAPVGATVAVLGRGFTTSDKVYVGTLMTETSFRSPNSLTFVVPALPAGRNYPVSVGTPGSGLAVGTLRIDEGTLTVAPSSLSMVSGDKMLLIFSIPSEAPAGGLLLDISTDVPDSVIMPVVTIPAGQRSVNVAVQGGQPGSGTLFVTAPGFSEVRVPISVN